jgi:hypothetical protein
LLERADQEVDAARVAQFADLDQQAGHHYTRLFFQAVMEVAR